MSAKPTETLPVEHLVPGQVWWMPEVNDHVTIGHSRIVGHRSIIMWKTGQREPWRMTIPGVGWRFRGHPTGHTCHNEDCERNAVWRVTWRDDDRGQRVEEFACDLCVGQWEDVDPPSIIGQDGPPPYSRAGLVTCRCLTAEPAQEPSA